MNVYQEAEYRKQLDFALWRKLFRYGSRFRKELVLLASVMVLTAAIDALYPLFTRYAVDNFVVPGTTAGVGRFGALYLSVVTLQAGNVLLLIILAGRIETGLAYDIRSAGFRRLQELSFPYYDRTPVGWIMARMTSDTQRLGEVISWGIVDVVWGSMMVLFFAIFMIVIDPLLAMWTLLVVPPLGVASFYFQKKILAGHREVRRTNSRISGAFNEGILGAQTTKTLVRESEHLSEFRSLTGSMARSSIRTAAFSALFLPVVLTMGSIGTALALWKGGSAVVAGTITYGTLVAFISYTVQFFDPVRELARVLTELQAAQAAAERVISMIETEPEIQDSPAVISRYGDSFQPRREAWETVRGEVEFRNVSFRYPHGAPVLEQFNIRVPAGQSLAIVGETGSGKTTLVNLTCRFYEPTSGQVLIDGRDYRERSLLWHQSHLGYVLQTPHLFRGTVKENIRYGRLDATDAEIKQAAETVNADDFIARLSNGYDSEVGEGGNLLSVGQKQLLSLARALVARPALFVLDEATSSVDTETELLIQEAIERVLQNRTSFIIAHRLSTVRRADRIIVLDSGRIVEDGNHAELMAAGGAYYRYVQRQFSAAATST